MMNEETKNVGTEEGTEKTVVTPKTEEEKESKFKNVITKVGEGFKKHRKKIIVGTVIVIGGTGLYKLFKGSGVEEVILADDIIEDVIDDVIDDVVSEVGNVAK